MSERIINHAKIAGKGAVGQHLRYAARSYLGGRQPPKGHCTAQSAVGHPAAAG